MSTLHPLASRVPHPAPLRHRPPALMMLLGLFGAPMAWSIQLLVVYLLIGDKCSADTPPGPPTYGPTAWIAGTVGVVAVLVCLAALFSAWRAWRLTRDEAPGRHHAALTAGHGRTRFLALAGIVSALTFLVAAIFELTVPFLVSPCALPFS